MTERDYEVVNFVSKIPCFADTIQQLFFPSMRVTNRRLAYLTDYNYLKRTRHGASDRYFYYVKKEPMQKMHIDYIAKTYNWIVKNGYKIRDLELQNKQGKGKIRPDMTLEIEKDGKIGIIAVEVELSNNDVKKKIRKYEEDGTFNKLLLVSNIPRHSDKIDIINVKVGDLI